MCQVIQDLEAIPELINTTLEQLAVCLPTYEHYCFALVHKANDSLRPHLVRIYEQYIYFCILAHRHAEESSYSKQEVQLFDDDLMSGRIRSSYHDFKQRAART